MSDAISSARSWTWPAWVDEIISDRDDSLKDAPQDPLKACELARETLNVRPLIKFRRAAEVQLGWLESELDRLKKEKDMLDHGKDPHTDEEKSRLFEEQKERFRDEFLTHCDHQSDQGTEHVENEQDARNEIGRFEKLSKDGEELTLRFEQAIMELELQQNV